MTIRKRTVRWIGLLRGNGEEAGCTVEALEVTNPAGGPPAYAQYEIIYVSRPLPSGVYDVQVNGQRFRVRHAHGHWTAV